MAVYNRIETLAFCSLLATGSIRQEKEKDRERERKKEAR